MSTDTPFVLKGALITLTDTPIVPIPSLIPFQYNPETLTRTITPHARQLEDGEDADAANLAQPGPPAEKFSLAIELDATDFFEDPARYPVGSIFGVAPKIANLEKLMYPTGNILGALIDAIKNLVSSVVSPHASPVPRMSVPITFFVWGPSRIIPVRIESLQIEEQAHTPILYPARAKASLSMSVIPRSVFQRTDGQTPSEWLAVAAHDWTDLNRDLLAVAGLVDTVVGLLPE